jgi:CO/xanthine dehydrogenase Mo-binding subunit
MGTFNPATAACRSKAAAQGELVAEDEMTYGDLSKQYAHQTFGAHFVELGVHAFTGEIRLRRMLAVCAAGRILNPKLARSQVIGAMVMGAGAALMENWWWTRALAASSTTTLRPTRCPCMRIFRSRT